MDVDNLLPDFEADNALPEGQPFPESVPLKVSQQAFARPSSELSEAQEEEVSAEAPLIRNRRGPRVLPMDMTQELRSAQLLQWNNEYVENMATASYHKLQHKLPSQARKNAAAWLFGSGIGGVGVGIGSLKLPSPLDMFAGDKLMEAMTGVEVSVAGKKRNRSDDDDHSSESEERRFRPRSDDGKQIGRGESLVLKDNDMLPQFDDMVMLYHLSCNSKDLTIRRMSKLVEKQCPYSKTTPLKCLGTSAPPFTALVKGPAKLLAKDPDKDPLFVAMDSLAALEVSPVPAKALSVNYLSCLIPWIVAPVVLPAPVPSLVAVAPSLDSEASSSPLLMEVKMKGYVSLMTKALKNSSSTALLLR